MKESASERTSKYIQMTTASLKRLRLRTLPSSVGDPQISHVLDLVHGYVNDAKHYAEKRKPVTALACIAYAEGLLDALKFLELAEF